MSSNRGSPRGDVGRNGSELTSVRTGDGAQSVTNTWDLQNRLASTSTTSGTTVTVGYTYDDDGNLTSVDGPSGLTSYLIDPQSLTGQPQTLEEFDGSGALTMSYIVGDRVLAQTPAGAGTAYLLIDGQGSTRQLTDATGTVTASFSYDAFGNITASSGTATTAYLYTGQRLDGASSTYALGIRLYDPTQGRFDSRDSFPGFLDAPLTMNPYAYCGGNPINYYDPSGNSLTGPCRADEPPAAGPSGHPAHRPSQPQSSASCRIGPP